MRWVLHCNNKKRSDTTRPDATRPDAEVLRSGRAHSMTGAGSLVARPPAVVRSTAVAPPPPFGRVAWQCVDRGVVVGVAVVVVVVVVVWLWLLWLFVEAFFLFYNNGLTQRTCSRFKAFCCSRFRLSASFFSCVCMLRVFLVISVARTFPGRQPQPQKGKKKERKEKEKEKTGRHREAD